MGCTHCIHIKNYISGRLWKLSPIFPFKNISCLLTSKNPMTLFPLYSLFFKYVLSSSKWSYFPDYIYDQISYSLSSRKVARGVDISIKFLKVFSSNSPVTVYSWFHCNYLLPKLILVILLLHLSFLVISFWNISLYCLNLSSLSTPSLYFPFIIDYFYKSIIKVTCFIDFYIIIILL